MANSLILTKAQNAITAHDWTTAARLYKELLRGKESNVEYLKQLGSIYVRAGQDEKAIPYYEQIITFNPESIEAMVSLGGIFRRLKRYEDSVSILNKAQDISSIDANISYSLGFTYKEMGDYDDAIDAFESVISSNPDDVLAHNHLGAIYFAKKEYDKAIATYKRGLQVDQNHPILNYNLAHVYEAMKNYPEAVRSYETALKTRPGWLEAIRDFSELLIKCQDTKQAQELVEQSIKLHPDDVDLLCILGRIYLNQFDYDNATKTFKRAESLKNHDIKILLGLSKALEKGMKIEPAMEKVLEAVDLDPENLDVCKQYAHVLLSAQRYDKALDLIKKIDEKSDGKDLQILDLYGQYFVCRSDEEAAETYFNKIRKINHHYKDYMINAADRYIQTGNYEKAEKMAEQFVESRPHLPEGYNLLGTINSARGELNKAKADYEKSLTFKNPNIYAVKELEKIYSEMEANQKIYNDSEMPIAVDADKLSEEAGGNLSEDGGLIDKGTETEDQLEAMMAGSAENPEEMLDNINSLESTPPIEQALTGEDNEFWEDFDDDPDAENKPLVDEEDVYDENEESPDLMSMLTPDAGENENSLANGLTEDSGDFDFGDFEDAAKPGEIEDAPLDEPEAVAEPEVKVEPEYATEVASQPVFESEPAPASSEPLQPSVSMPEAQQMMNDLKQQKKELELQQRELALQQKEFADELKSENEKLIHETVEKAVEEKFSEYDLTPESESEPETEPKEESLIVEEEPAADDQLVEEEPAADEELVVDNESSDDDSLSEDDDLSPCEEAASDEIPADDFDLQLYDDDFTETGFGDELAEEDLSDDNISLSESEEILAEEAALDGLNLEDNAMTYEEKEEASTEPFVTVEEITELSGGAPATLAKPVSEAFEKEEELSDESFVTADDMLDKIGRILNDDNLAKNCSEELQLFKKLRSLSSFLPEKEKNSFDCCRMRMVIEYIIQKMSGKPGLLITAESLIKSGVLGEEYNRQLEDCCEEELSNDLVRHVITDMKKLAQGLEDKELCNALCVSADGILEQIALLDQKSAIF